MLPLDEESDAEDSGVGPPVPSGENAPAELRRAFWVLVVVFNGALLGVSLGAMLVVFRGDLPVGGSLLVLGAGLGFYGWRRYRVVTDRDWAGDGNGDEATGDDATEGEGA